jgi:hypothetical protein
VIYGLVLGTLGVAFAAVGGVCDEIPFLVLGSILILEGIYALCRKHATMTADRERQQERRSFVFAGVIGASFATAVHLGDH